MTKTGEALYQEREKRVTDTIALKIPDRIPIMLELSYFPAKYCGISYEAAYHDYDLWLNASRRTVEDFNPDIVWLSPFFPGTVFDILKPRQLKLPGQNIPAHQSHRFIEAEFMKPDEYDFFLDDPTDFMLRCFLPRIMGGLEPLSHLPPFSEMTHDYREVTTLAEMLVSSETIGALETLMKAGHEMLKWREQMAAFGANIENLGVPLHGTITVSMPFDMISYHWRGLLGIYKDMFNQPDKLIEVLDKLLHIQIEKALKRAKNGGRKRVFCALHRGSDIFLSPKQFETFYWPYAKRIVQTLIDEGYTPCLFLEGDYTSRLEYFLELPSKKVLARMDSSDIKKVKEVFHGHICIMGNVPSSLLQVGTPQDVENYCKKLIDEVGKDGGLIVTPRSSIDEANPENIKRMVDVTKEYGRYK
jgi:hypothetical protein